MSLFQTADDPLLRFLSLEYVQRRRSKMTGRYVHSVWILCALLATPTGLYAQTPVGTAFSYQGRLTDGSSPANGDYDFNFSLYDASMAAARGRSFI